MKKMLSKFYALLITLVAAFGLIRGAHTKDIYEIVAIIGILLIAILIELIHSNDKKR